MFKICYTNFYFDPNWRISEKCFVEKPEIFFAESRKKVNLFSNIRSKYVINILNFPNFRQSKLKYQHFNFNLVN